MFYHSICCVVLFVVFRYTGLTVEERTPWLKFIDSKFEADSTFVMNVNDSTLARKVYFKFLSHDPIERTMIESVAKTTIYRAKSAESETGRYFNHLWVSGDNFIALANFLQKTKGGTHSENFLAACSHTATIIVDVFEKYLDKNKEENLAITIYWRKQLYAISFSNKASKEENYVQFDEEEKFKCLEGAPGAGKSTIGPYLVDPKKLDFFVPENVCFLYKDNSLGYFEIVFLIEQLRFSIMKMWKRLCDKAHFLLERRPWSVMTFLFTPFYARELRSAENHIGRAQFPYVKDFELFEIPYQHIQMIFTISSTNGKRCAIESKYTLNDVQINYVIRDKLMHDRSCTFGSISTSFEESAKEFDFSWEQRPIRGYGTSTTL